ncbi:MAG: DUF2336 domain-containing protein [Alphaproteobacteria bacterium]|nr:DUF2336 domain-containing protein [Alphaproteobacteria bacterium]MCD8526277.1 DUF2336 domain-containing protein [Alphaproteobacteria bacterium]
MKKWIEKFLGGGKSRKGYKAQTDDLKSADIKRRMTLATDDQTSKEILYYLAEKDPSPKVRKAVAQNASIPLHVTPILATDREADVRLALAKRLVELLPDLTDDKHSQLYAYAVQALGTLALDEVLKIRIALSSTLKDHAHTPPKIAGQLARDVEREVSEPILRFCAALSDADLLDILKGHPASWAVEAIALRPVVSEPVSEAVIETDDIPGGVALLGNSGALMTAGLLQQIVEKARAYPEWQKPMATRATLPPSIAKELAEFVDASVRDILMTRDDFDPEDTEEIAAVFRRRLDFTQESEMNMEPVEKRVKKALAKGQLDEDMLSDAIAMRDSAFVNTAIAQKIGVPVEVVTKVFELKAPKSIVALAWQAGLSMRMALQLQKEMGYVRPQELIYPRDGTDYPLTDEEILWQLDFMGLKNQKKNY